MLPTLSRDTPVLLAGDFSRRTGWTLGFSRETAVDLSLHVRVWRTGILLNRALRGGSHGQLKLRKHTPSFTPPA